MIKRYFAMVAIVFLTIAQLQAQESPSSDIPSFSLFSLKVEPLNTDSLKAVIKDMGLGSVAYVGKHLRVEDNVGYFDNQILIHPFPKDLEGTLKIKQLPKDYPSNMPILPLKHPDENAMVIPPKQ